MYTAKPLRIDGCLADWEPNTQPLKINRKENIVFGFTDWAGEEDVSARVYTAWDKNYFYLAAEVEDTKLSFPCTGFHIYNNDGIEIYFDIDHEGDAEIQSYNQDDFQYAVSLSEGKELVWCYQLGGPSKKSLAKINTKPTQSETLSRKQFTGYILETAIPLSELKLKRSKGKLIGFNVGVNDDDDPESLNPFVQELQLSWTGMKNAYQNTAAFADLFFVRAEKPKSGQIPCSADGKLLTESAKYWLRKVAEFQQQNKTELAEVSGGIVLLGDSLTERFPVEELMPDSGIVNRGIGGDKIGGWKYYGLIDRLEISVYALKPRKLFIQIGINDIVYAHTPTRIMKKGYKRLLTELKRNCPQSEIYVQSILPVRGKWTKYNRQIEKFNQIIEHLCKKYGVHYVNLYQQFVDENGSLKA
ncbi:MAG: GDSL-type esterase/lipase family protein, partial [Candidatus Sumerlaeia bacterium]|nr:GDSL-type esterase/lipase family protein [Candidatus Sumerlaeia bacterium]